MPQEQNEQDRQLQLERLFHQNYGHILDLVLADRRLLPQDSDHITQSIARHLDSYDGPIEAESFKKWIEEAVNGAVERIGFFYELRKECRNSVRSAIWNILASNIDLLDSSPAVVISQIESNVWVWCLHHLDDLKVVGSAKLSTRLAAQARFQTLTWRKTRLRDNKKFDDVDVERFGNESHQVIGRDFLYFDPEQDDDEDGSDQPVRRPQKLPIRSPDASMQSGHPRLWCPLCKCLQATSSDPSNETVTLWCGHQRPGVLIGGGLTILNARFTP